MSYQITNDYYDEKTRELLLTRLSEEDNNYISDTILSDTILSDTNISNNNTYINNFLFQRWRNI